MSLFSLEGKQNRGKTRIKSCVLNQLMKILFFLNQNGSFLTWGKGYQCLPFYLECYYFIQNIQQVTCIMLYQIPTTAVGIVLLIIAIVLLFIFNWLAVRLIESRELARRKKGMCFLVALIGVFMFIIVIWLWSLAFGSIPPLINTQELIWPNMQPILALGPMIVFLLYILLVHGLIGAEWKKSVWIGFLALLLLATFLAFTPFAAQYLTFYPMT